MEKIPYFDAHCDTLWRCQTNGWRLEENPGHLDLARLGAYGPVGQVFALYENSAKCLDCFGRIQAQAALFLQARADHPALLKNCRLAVEGAELLDCRIDRLETVRQWGGVWVNLTWNHANALAGPHTTDRGLTPAGRDFVRAMGEQGLLVDVSHLSDRGFWDVLEAVQGPVVASHSDSRALCPHSRNLTDDMARALFERGGYVGLNFCVSFLGEDPTVETVVRHLEHFLELGGENCVGLGSDFDGTDLPPELAGVQDIPKLWTALEKRGYPEALLQAIFSGNLRRVLGV